MPSWQSHAAAAAAAPRSLPRSVVLVGLPLVCLLLVAFFSVLVFPYERFGDVLAAQLEQATGAKVELGELTGGLSLGGPALAARPVRLRWPDQSEFRLDEAHVRPAWSFSWLRGKPALAIDLRGPAGQIAGTAWPSSPLAFAGRLQQVALDQLPLERLLGAMPLHGVADAEVELRLTDAGPRGSVSLELRNGDIAVPELPFAIPFERLTGQIQLGEEGGAALKGISLEGPAVALTAEGSLGPGPRLVAAPLDLAVEFEVVDTNLRQLVQAQGARLDGAGKGKVRVTGSLSQPVLR